jgi:hypothetical protein
MPHKDIEAILVEELERAKAAHKEAAREFKTMSLDIPSGLPSPDGRVRIDNAGVAYRSTMEAYARALKEFSDFISRGEVPPRLKE